MKTILVALLLTGIGYAQTNTYCDVNGHSVNCTSTTQPSLPQARPSSIAESAQTGYVIGSAVGSAIRSAFVALAARDAKHLLTKQRFCLEIVNRKDFNGYSKNTDWCPQFMYENAFLGVPYMTDQELAAAQRTCEAHKLNGSYKVKSPNLKYDDKFSCLDLADVVHEGWNK